MKISSTHDWNLTPAQAVSLQHDLAGRLAELDWAVGLVLKLALRFRLPETLRAAHRLAENQRRRITGSA